MNNLFYIKKKFLLSFFWSIIIFSFILWLFALISNPRGEQLSLFFERTRNFWADATNVTGMIADRNPYFSNEKGSYPPLAYLLFYPLILVSSTPEKICYADNVYYYLYYYQPLWVLLFVVFLIIIVVAFYTLCFQQFRNYSVSNFDAIMTCIAFCLSYPMLYTIERGNILIVSMLALSVFIFYYDSQCKWKKECALFSLAISIGLKLSPAIFGVLLIQSKDWKALVRVICYSMFFLIFPFFFFNGGIYNLLQLINNLKYISEDLVARSCIIGTGILPSCLKYFSFFVEKNGGTYTFSMILYILTEVLRFGISLLLFWGIFYLQEKWKMIMNLTIILLLLPKISFFYCVLYMVPFTVVFLNSLNEKNFIDKLLIYICLIMLYFVYRCPISNYFDYNFAIPLLAFIACAYSIEAYIKKRKLKFFT